MHHSIDWCRLLFPAFLFQEAVDKKNLIQKNVGRGEEVHTPPSPRYLRPCLEFSAFHTDSPTEWQGRKNLGGGLGTRPTQYLGWGCPANRPPPNISSKILCVDGLTKTVFGFNLRLNSARKCRASASLCSAVSRDRPGTKFWRVLGRGRGNICPGRSWGAQTHNLGGLFFLAPPYLTLYFTCERKFGENFFAIFFEWLGPFLLFLPHLLINHFLFKITILHYLLNNNYCHYYYYWYYYS